ncbi:MAG: hypothetical protein ACYDBJ_24435 [Aggregatilineales bacterium]
MFRNLYAKIDRSPRLANYLQALSGGLSRRRGLPILIAIGLTVLSLLAHLILAFVPSSAFLAVVAFVLLHTAILVGLIGVLLAEPVGRG